MLPKDIRKKTPAQLKVLVDAGLFDDQPIEKLAEVGFFDPDIFGRFVGMDSNGDMVWLPQDTTGRLPFVEQNSANISAYSSGIRSNSAFSRSYALISSPGYGLTDYHAPAKLAVPFTLAGGSYANLELVPPLAGYYGVLDRVYVICDTAIAPVTLTFQDEDDATLLGGLAAGYNVTLQANVLNKDLDELILSQATYTDNKALEVDISGGAGAESGFILPWYHYET